MPYEGEIVVNNLPQGTTPNQADKIMLIDHETGELKQFGVASLSTVVSDVSFTNAAKNALIALLEKVAYIDQNGQQYLNELIANLAATVTSISAVFTQGSAVVYETDSLESLRQYLVVTANYSDGTSDTVNSYTLSGTLTVGTSTITVSYGGKTTTFVVIVSNIENTYFVIPNNDDLHSGYINTSGEIVEQSGSYFIDKFIPAKIIAFAGTSALSTKSSSNYMRVAEYDSNKTFIRASSTNNINMFTPGSDASYVKVGWNNDTAWRPSYVLFLAYADLALYTESDKTIDASGNIISENGPKVTDFIELNSETITFLYLANIYATVKVAFYASDYSFIERQYVTGITGQEGKNSIGSVPSNAVYMRFTTVPTLANMFYPVLGELQ